MIQWRLAYSKHPKYISHYYNHSPLPAPPPKILIQDHKGYVAGTPRSNGGLQKWTNPTYDQVLISSISVPRTEASGGKGQREICGYITADMTGPAEGPGAVVSSDSAGSGPLQVPGLPHH